MLLSKERVLTEAQLKRLDEHKYSCTNCSLSESFMQLWWTWLVNKLPLWLAPNLITVSGLVINILTSLILIFYSPDGKQEVPRWACFLCALGLFIYQSLDAVDGKQARRTGTSSPLGELFDHGCDSISTIFVALGVCISVQLGVYPDWMFFHCFCASTLFYCAHWQTYVSGTLRFGKIDVTEAQFGVIMIHLISSIFGTNIWSTQIPGIGVTFLFLGVVGASSINLMMGSNYMHSILQGGVGKNGSTVAGTSVLSPVIPYSLVVVPAFIIYQKSEQHVYHEHPALYILAFGFVTAKVTNRLVIAHMTKSEMEYLDSALLGPAMLFLNQYFNTFIKEYYVLWMCMIWATFDLWRYCSQVCLEICDHMKIYLLKITPKSPPAIIPTPASERNGNIRLTRRRVRDTQKEH